jgi:hypothetical protein
MSFPITCTACHKTFTVSDEIYEKKVAGRVVTIKCKSCGQGIRVDGTKGAGGAIAAAPATTAAPAEPIVALWAVDYPDGQDREFTDAEVFAELERDAINGSTLVWREGMAEWLELGQVPELAGELAKIEAKKQALAAAAAAAKAQAEAAAKAAAEATAKAAAKAAMPKAAPAPVHAQARFPAADRPALGRRPHARASTARATTFLARAAQAAHATTFVT